jgi:hypothetical protein
MEERRSDFIAIGRADDPRDGEMKKVKSTDGARLQPELGH